LLWKVWIAIAGTALIAGGVAWVLKVCVILATDGRVTHTGAAATFLDLGLGLFLVGSTGVGLRLAMSQDRSMRVILAAVSPLVFGACVYPVFGGIGYIILVIWGAHKGVAVPSYLLEEGGILVSAVVGLIAGLGLVVEVVLRGVPDSTDGASGSRQAEPQPGVR
jgi:hypothetical protein